jgi:hypothetical protein
MGACRCAEAVASRQEVGHDGPKAAHLFHWVARGLRRPQARDNQILVDIQTTTAFIDELPTSPPSHLAKEDGHRGAGKAAALLRAGEGEAHGVFPSFATDGGPWSARTGLLCRLNAPKRERSRRVAHLTRSVLLFMGAGASATHARLLSCWVYCLLENEVGRGDQYEQDASGHPDGGFHRPVLRAVPLPLPECAPLRALHRAPPGTAGRDPAQVLAPAGQGRPRRPPSAAPLSSQRRLVCGSAAEQAAGTGAPGAGGDAVHPLHR